MLAPVAPDLWTVDHVLALPGRVRMPVRMTVVRRGDGGLWIHSPVPLDDLTAAALAALGPVRTVVAPNAFHHLFVAPLLARFPQARLLGVPALQRKRRDLRFAGPPEPTPELEPVAIDGVARLDEVV